MCKSSKSRSYLLHLSTIGADHRSTAISTRFTTNLTENIPIYEGERAYLSVRHARIPNVFYQINNSNNVFSITNQTTLITSNFAVAPGTYSGNQLAAEIYGHIQSVYPGLFFISFNTPTAKFFIENNSPDVFLFNLNNVNNIADVLGFESIVYPIQIGSEISSVFPAHLTPYSEVYLHSDLNLLHTYDSKLRNRSSLVETFPLANSPIGTDLFFSNTNTEFRSEIVARNVNQITLWLTDRYNRELDLIIPGFDYEVSLLIQIE